MKACKYCDDVTFNKMTLSIMTLSTMTDYDTQHDDFYFNDTDKSN